jgi:hypothetical protein
MAQEIAIYLLDQDPEYSTYPIGYNGFVNTMQTDSLKYELFGGFSTRNVEP